MEYEFNIKNALGALIAGFEGFAEATVFAAQAAENRRTTLRVIDRKGKVLVQYTHGKQPKVLP